MKRIAVLLLFATAFFVRMNAQMVVTINGSPNFSTADLSVTEAGNDFSGVISESLPVTTMSVNDVNKGNREYTIYASLSSLQGTLVLEVKRLNDGTTPTGGQASGKINGGLTYIQLSTTPVPFFTVKGDRNNILLGFGLSNVSVTQPAGNVAFSVVFTAQ